MKRKIIVQFKFSAEEAAITRAKNPSNKANTTVLCDAQNFCFVNFSDATIVAGDESKETAYLVSKAKGENPKPLKKAKGE